ncbi:MAG: T9SS type A sorting domain-containing protein [Saprospiraceae bacterium]
MKRFFLPVFALFLLAIGGQAQTIASVEEVYNIFQNRCVSCHDHASPEAGLDLEGQGANNNLKAIFVAGKLVNKNPTNATALGKGDRLVFPGHPHRSFLFRKINEGFEPTIAALHAGEGDDMPGPAYPGEMTAKEKEIIRQWILYGAKTAGVQFNKALVEQWYDNNGLKSFPDGPPPAPAPGEGFQLKMGPFYLPPDGEVEYYLKNELRLPADVEVNRVDIKFSPYSHHFIIYSFTGAAGANANPQGLRTQANHFDINLTAAVQEQTDLRLPATTAFHWKKDLVLDLNSHYINYSADRPYQCEAYINVYTQPVGTAAQEMFATLIANPNIPIPNNGNNISHTQNVFTPGADSIYIWGLMGHTHKYGTGYKVWKRLPNGQKGEPLYDAACPFAEPGCPSPYFDYRHIPMRYWLPLLPIKWSNGLIHEATYVNDGPAPVQFGPTSNDEMMVLVAFYTEKPIVLDAQEPDNQLKTPTVQVQPNPASDRLTFTLTGERDAHALRLFDATGREVLRRTDLGGRTFSVEVADWPPGIYLFNLDGHTGKVVIQ